MIFLIHVWHCKSHQFSALFYLLSMVKSEESNPRKQHNDNRQPRHAVRRNGRTNLIVIIAISLSQLWTESKNVIDAFKITMDAIPLKRSKKATITTTLSVGINRESKRHTNVHACAETCATDTRIVHDRAMTRRRRWRSWGTMTPTLPRYVGTSAKVKAAWRVG